MRRTTTRRLALCLGLAFCLSPVWAAPPAQRQSFTGKVVPLAGLVEKLGSKLDADAAPHWLALVGDDGKVYPLVKDDGGRMFFAHDQTRELGIALTVIGEPVLGHFPVQWPQDDERAVAFEGRYL